MPIWCGAVVFMVLVAPWLGKHLSWALFVISILLILATLSLLFATALTNPGYLPRNEDSYSEDVEWGCAMYHLMCPLRVLHAMTTKLHERGSMSTYIYFDTAWTVGRRHNIINVLPVELWAFAGNPSIRP